MHSVGRGTDVWKHSCETLLFLVTLSFLEPNISPRLYYSMSSVPRSSSSAAALEQEGAWSLSWLRLARGAGLMGCKRHCLWWWAAGRLVTGTGDTAVNEMGNHRDASALPCPGRCWARSLVKGSKGSRAVMDRACRSLTLINNTVFVAFYAIYQILQLLGGCFAVSVKGGQISDLSESPCLWLKARGQDCVSNKRLHNT